MLKIPRKSSGTRAPQWTIWVITTVWRWLTVPAAAGGLILGKGGANIQGLAEQSGAGVAMSSKEEGMFTQERVLTISGTAGSCIKCTNLLLQKLDEPAEVISYANRGTSYSTPVAMGMGMNMNMGGGMGMGAPYGGGMHYGGGGAGGGAGGMHGGGGFGIFAPNHYGGGMGGSGATMGGGGGGHQQQQQRGKRDRSGGYNNGSNYKNGGENGGGADSNNNSGGGGSGGAIAAAESTIVLSVPNDLVGNIFGRQVSYNSLFVIWLCWCFYSLGAIRSRLASSL